MSKFELKDPPPPVCAPTIDYGEAARFAMEHPNRWISISQESRKSVANYINSGRVAAMRKDFESTSRSLGGGNWEVFIRYIGK